MIVIPMAGQSSRFQRAGYTQPKWRLEIGGHSLFDLSIRSFERFFNSEQFIIICRDDDGSVAYVKGRMRSLGIQNFIVVPLSSVTRGQAETVSLGLKNVKPSGGESLTIFNIDTIRPNFSGVRTVQNCSGWIECVNAEGMHWSFVKPSNTFPFVAERVVEKFRISNLCSTGVYYFSSVEIFQDAYKEEIAHPSSHELFVAPLYQKMIDNGLTVGYDLIAESDIFFSGTPDEFTHANLIAPQILKKMQLNSS